MSFLTRLAVSRALATLLLSIAVLLLGAYATTQLRAELLPEIDFPMVTVITVYPGSAPDDVVEQVTKPLEAAISGTPGLRNLQSTSASDLSLIVAEFAYGTDMKKTEATIAASTRDIKLPSGTQTPKVARIDPNSFPIVRLSVTTDGDTATIEQVVRDRLVPALTAVEGVHSVEVTGGADQQVSVLVDPVKAKEKRVSFQQIASLLQANNLAMPGGNVAVQGENVPVRTIHEFRSLEEIGNLVVGAAGAPTTRPSAADMAGGQLGAEANQIPSLAGAATMPPAGGTGATLAPDAGPTAAAQGGQQYVVKPGDNLSTLAARFGTSVEALTSANRLSSPHLIYAGSPLIIPAVARGTTASPAAAAASSGAAATTPQTVALKDIAEVRVETASGAVVRTNGRPGLALSIAKSQNANTVKVAREVLALAEAVNKELADKGEVGVVVDESSVVQHSIDGLLREGAIGGALAVVVVFLFLASARGALTVAVSIPLSLMVAFLLMWWQDFTLNIMTLGGLAVAIGRVVDDSIVVSESILRRVQSGEPLEAAVRGGTAEVISPVTSSTLTTVGVFLPLGLVSGLAGQVFRPFAFTVTFALLASLFCAVTVIPALSHLLVRRRAPTGNAPESFLAVPYSRALSWALRHRRITVALAALLFLGSLATIPFIPRSLLPSEQEKVITINVAPPAQAGADWVASRVGEVEDVLEQTAGIDVYQSTRGGRDDLRSLMAALEGQDTRGATILVRLARDTDLPAKTEELQAALTPLEAGGTIGISRQQSAANTRLQVVATGEDDAKVADGASTILRALQGVPGLANVTSDAATVKREFAVAVDPNKALPQGLTTAQVAMQVRQMFAGQSVTRVRFGGGEPMEVRLALPEQATTSLEDLRNLPFGAANQQPLSSIAEVSAVERPTRITRVASRPGISITGDIVARNTGEVSDAVRKRIADLNLPSGVRVVYGGVISEMEDSFAQMYVALGLAVLLVFAVMTLFFSSLKEPAVILVSLPLAAIGALLALAAAGRTLGLPALIGLLMLVGIVVTNAIVLMDLVKHLRDDGRPLEEALLVAGRTRVRPIVMTALTTILALLPLALGFNQGAIIAAELATVVIGGLFTSTLLTLLVVPVIYAMLSRPRAQGAP